ncbi:MAG: putative transporter permease/ATP-binding protein [Ilumatobacteraceae bacterium]|nr:putative transporter permease/ATP-binding protein [Ilumatobacteraceae bacterium]
MVETAVVGERGTIIPDAGGSLTKAFRLLRALLRRHKRLFFTAVGGAAVYAACTVFSSVVVGMITDKLIVPRFEGPQHRVEIGSVVAVLGLLIAVGLLRAAGIVVRRVWAGRTNWRVTESVTAEVIERMIVQPAPWHRRQSTGDLITRAGVDAEAATAVLGPLPYATSVALMIVLSSVWLLITDWVLGLAAVAIFPILIVLNLIYQKRVDRFFDTAQDELGRLSSAVHESFEGVAVVKSFGAESRETERLAVIAGRVREARLGAVRIRSTFEALLDGVPNLANVALLLGGAYRVRSGQMTVGELTSFIFLFTLLVFPLRLIGFALSELPHSLAGWNRIRELLGQTIEPDPAATLRRGAGNDVRLDDVHYGYDPARPVLRGVTADVQGGRTVAVVGATGSGKTTLLQLMAGMIAADSGTVTVPRRGCLLVFQEPFLLAGTARENITMGASLDEVTIADALRVAEATFLAELPNGLDTEVGERGVGLSGGQRQRLALARALVRHPPVLLLDDTTSALDPGTEARVLANLRASLTDTTVVAVASRPSTIALADEVLYLDGGVVVAHAAHDELMAAVPGYRALIEAFEHDRESIEIDIEIDGPSDNDPDGGDASDPRDATAGVP